MRKVWVLVVLGVVIAGFTPVDAGSSADITVTVTPSGILSISVTPTTWDAGTQAYGNSTNTGNSGYFNVTNDGTITCKVQIKGSDTTDWTLSTTAGYNQFSMNASIDSWNTVVQLTTNLQDLISSLNPNDYQTFDLGLTMPTSGSTSSQQSITVTVQAVSL